MNGLFIAGTSKSDDKKRLAEATDRNAKHNRLLGFKVKKK